ncbi:MAG: heavy metal translocating P-type ATPase, partial [Spirochaetales bacterium]|nr:heavy metal translocating P-type ATPase [Spirochaetales bacterium]
MKYHVIGMSCAACQARVSKAVSNLDGVTNCAVNLLTNSMIVDGDVSPDTVIYAVRQAGYDAAVQSAKPINQNKSKVSDEIKNNVIRLLTSGIILVVLMYFGMGMMFGLPAPSAIKNNQVLLGIIEFFLSGAILVINRRFFINGAKGILHLSPNMDTLVALGSGVSFIYSTVILILLALGKNVTSTDYYFESAGMILVLITVGKLLETIAKGRTTDALRALSDLTPQNAVVVRDGQEFVIPVSEILVGDEIIIRPGENVPADGNIISGTTSVNESALTGESMPVNKAVSDQVYTGTINLNGVIHIRAEKVGSETVLSKIITMVADASAAKAPIARVADQVSGVFVPIVTLIAAMATIVWLLVGQTLEFALVRGICVLVISCPCALGLATPVAIMVGSGVAARHNILFKTAESLELTGRIKTVILDKTGTVTKGEPVMTGVHRMNENVTEQDILQTVYSLERHSRHPLAEAVCRYADTKNVTCVDVTDVSEIAGHGLTAIDSDRMEIAVGSVDFISSQINENERAALTEQASVLSVDGQTMVAAAKNHQLMGILTFSDEIKSDSIAAAEHLHK